jgi:hypothetical protein
MASESQLPSSSSEISLADGTEVLSPAVSAIPDSTGGFFNYTDEKNQQHVRPRRRLITADLGLD